MFSLVLLTTLLASSFCDRTLLAANIRGGNVEAIRKFLNEKDSDVVARILNERVNGEAPAYVAMELDRVDIAVMLIEKSDVNLMQFPGKNGGRKEHYLHLAVHKLFLPCVRALLDGGANPLLKNYFEETPLHVLFENSEYQRWNPTHQVIGPRKDPRDCRTDVDETDLIALRNRRDEERALKIMDLLVEKGGKDLLKATDYNGSTAVHLACQRRLLTYLIALLKHGADVNALDKYAQTGLHYAMGDDKNFEIVRVLIENEANVELKNQFGNTALSLAVGYKNTRIVSYLLEKGGASVDAVNERGDSIVDKAVATGNEDILRAVMKAKLKRQEMGASADAVNEREDSTIDSIVDKAMVTGNKYILKAVMKAAFKIARTP